MLKNKQRSYLKGLAHNIDSIFQIGKNGISENFITQIDEALEARELIKISILKNSLCYAKQVCEELTQRTNSESVLMIGSKIVLYRESKHNKKIILPKA